jgi:hypothetical protein
VFAIAAARLIGNQIPDDPKAERSFAIVVRRQAPQQPEFAEVSNVARIPILHRWSDEDTTGRQDES